METRNLSELELTGNEKQLGLDEIIRFFGVLSHDLKSPIFSIDGFSDLLLSDYGDKLDDEGRDFLHRVRSGAHQMKCVLDEMTHMVRLLTRPNSIQRVDVGEVAEELRLKYNYLIGESGVDFRVPADLPVINADPEKFRETLGVLISNALTFTDRQDADRLVAIEWSSDERARLFSVRDNGIGIDPRYCEQIFELGLKLDKSRGDGAGYGLYMARQIVRSHGGDLTVASEHGEGSIFSLTIPQ